MDGLLERLDAYLHAVPLSGAEAVEVGRFTVFRSRVAWPYYSRPRPGGGAVTAADVEAVVRRCGALGLPVALEWVVDTAPQTSEAARAAGLEVIERPLLVLERTRLTPQAAPDATRIEILPPDPDRIGEARRVADVAFSGDESAGPRPDFVATMLERAAAGVTVTAAAFTADGTLVSAGQHQPLGDCSEIVGVATLPAHRRRGLAAAITTALADDAFGRRGVELCLLSAQDAAAARVYERVGFHRVGSVGEAAPASA